MIIIKKRFTDWLIQLANRGFGLSTDAFLKSVKKFLDKGVRTIRRSGSFPDHTSVICYVYFTMIGSQIDLYFWNRLPDYFAIVREAYKSLAVDICV